MRSPGRLTRFSPVITGCLSVVYFRSSTIFSNCLSPGCTLKSLMKPSCFRMSAIASFSFDFGMLTLVWRCIQAFRIRVSISAIGSFTLTLKSPNNYGHYQLDFVTPGSRPRSARSRKQIRHMPNRRIYARERPQSLHRLCCCVLNLGGCWDLTISALRANGEFLLSQAAQPGGLLASGAFNHGTASRTASTMRTPRHHYAPM